LTASVGRVIGAYLVGLVWVGSAAADLLPPPRWTCFIREAPPPSSQKEALTEEERSRRDFAGGREVQERNRLQPYVAFTFDDGPRPETTPRILQTLEDYNVPAAFFVVGDRFTGARASDRKGEKLLQDIAIRGHLIGNHTFAHRNLRKQSRKAMKRAITSAEAAIRRVLGRRTHLFRAPYGALNKRVRTFLRESEYTHVHWSIDSKDYLTSKPHALRRRVSRAIRRNEGGVVLFHDIKEQTVKALPGVLADLEAENCNRLTRGELPILPVELHYFIAEPNGANRPVPAAVASRTQAYERRLRARCQRQTER